MMTNLFSIFDPSTQIMNLSLNWLSVLLIFILTPYNYWLTHNSLMFLFYSISSTLKKEISTLLGKTSFKGASMIMINLFIFILILNVMGLIPYIFTPTSHPIMTVTLALPLWLGIILYGWINHTMHMFAHLVPQGTPILLMSFMVCIETISNIIRPLTLSVRLAANMIAGHLLMTLLGNQGNNITTFLMPLLITQLLLLILESAIAMIQAYVFIVLTILYASETSYDKP